MTKQKTIHLFNVHSHITYLLACAVIRHRNIDLKNVVFLLKSDYVLPRNPINVRMFVIPNEWFLFSFYYAYDYARIRKNLVELARFINQITEEQEYVWYPPHTNMPYQKVIASFERCLNYCVIEEGFFIHPDINKLTYPLPPYNSKLMNLCNENRLLFLDSHFICTNHPKYDCTFVSFKQNIPEIKNQVVLSDVFSKVDVPQLESTDAVLLFDKLAKVLRGGYDTHNKTLEWLIRTRFRRLEYKNIAYRLRLRDNSDESNQGIMEVFKQFPEMNFSPIDDSVVMENAIYSYDLPYYFLTTSLGFYAGVMGRSVYSFAPTYWTLEPNYRYFLEHLKISLESFQKRCIKLLPAELEDGMPIPFVHDSIMKIIRRKGMKYAKKFIPLSILAKLQEMMPHF